MTDRPNRQPSATIATLREINTAVVFVNAILEAEEPRRSSLITSLLSSSDRVAATVLNAYLSLLPHDLDEVPRPTSRTEEVRAFLMETYLITHGDGGVRGSDLYDTYARSCRERDREPMTQSAFGRVAGRLTPKKSTNRGVIYPFLVRKCKNAA